MPTINEARSIRPSEIEKELSKYRQRLEDLGLDHEEACGFLRSVMNLGIALHENLKRFGLGRIMER